MIKKCICENWERMQTVTLHDWFCYAYARSQGYHWYIDLQSTMLYRQHEDNQVGVNSGFSAFFYRFNKIIDGSGIKQSVLIAQLVGMENEVFVQRWSNYNSYGFLRLAFFANECRRKKQDKFLFFFACLFLAVLRIGK